MGAGRKGDAIVPERETPNEVRLSVLLIPLADCYEEQIKRRADVSNGLHQSRSTEQACDLWRGEQRSQPKNHGTSARSGSDYDHDKRRRREGGSEREREWEWREKRSQREHEEDKRRKQEREEKEEAPPAQQNDGVRVRALNRGQIHTF